MIIGKSGKILILLSICFFFASARSYCDEESPLFWPPPPAKMRISFVKTIYSPQDMGIKKGFFSKFKRLIFGEEKDILNKPVAVAVDKEKTLYICDTAAASVYIINPKEKLYKKINVINKEELLSPVGIAVSQERNVFIADSSLRKVFCLDKTGSLKFTLGVDNKFLRPTGLAVSKERLYVVDTLNHAVFIFDLKGNFIAQFGRRGRQEGEFNYPVSIAVDDKDKIYIVDTLNFRVQVFDSGNKFLYSIGQLGDSSGSFSRPRAVAVDSFGHIYVIDALFDNIQIFNRKKEFLLSLGEAGNKDGEFWMPSGIAIDKDNFIYVADSYNQRIQVLKYVGKD